LSRHCSGWRFLSQKSRYFRRSPSEELVGRNGPTEALKRQLADQARLGPLSDVRQSALADQDLTGLGLATLYRERNGVERLVGLLNEYRRIATRYDKLAAR
jgi:hypothetical protein